MNIKNCTNFRHLLLLCLITLDQTVLTQITPPTDRLFYKKNHEDYYGDTIHSGLKTVLILRAMTLGKQTQDTLFILNYDAFGRIESKTIKIESYGFFNYAYWYSEDKKQFASISSNNNQHQIILHQKDALGHIISSSTYNGITIQDTLAKNLTGKKTFVYNDSGKLISESLPGIYSTVNSYDEKGLLVQSKTTTSSPASSNLLEYIYDENKQLKLENTYMLGNDSKFKISEKVFTYEAGQCVLMEHLSLSHPDYAISHAFSYDSENRITKYCKRVNEEFGCANYTYSDNRLRTIEATMTKGYFCVDLGMPPVDWIDDSECKRQNYYDERGNLQKMECYSGPLLSDIVVFNLEYFK